MKLGEILKDLLDLHDLTQKQLAEALDLSPSALGNYIQGTREPDYGILIRIADYFHVTTDFLLNHPAKELSSDKTLFHKEEQLLHIFRSLTEEQQEFYLEQGQIFLRQNRKKESSPLSPVRGDSREVS